MSEPTQMPSQAVKQHVGHASMPRFATWIQDNLLLPLLILASGYINGIMLVDGWVPNIEDPNTWGLFHGVGVFVLFAAGLGMGGLTLRVSYKLAECYGRREWGRVIFMAVGIMALAFVEFWSSFSQRAQNIHPTPADNALLGMFDIHNPSVSLTAILISVAAPFVSLFWGFAAEDPAPKPVEDPETLEARLRNERIKAQHNAEMRQIGAAGVRGAAGALFGGNAATVAQPLPETTPTADPVTPPRMPPQLASAIRRGRAPHVETSADTLAAQTP